MIFIVRHGQTVWNSEKRFQGHLNSPLTKLGENQAEAIGKKLITLIDLNSDLQIYSSTLGRAEQTCKIITEIIGYNHSTVIKTENLKECNYGNWQGFTKDEVMHQYPGEIEKRNNDKWNYKIPNGESYHDLYLRAENWLKSIPSDKNVLIIAHEMINRMIRGVLLKLTVEEMLSFHQPNDTLLTINDLSEIRHTAEQSGELNEI